MEDQDKTKEQLINELAEMRQRVTELEMADAERKRVEEEIRQRNRELAALNTIATVVSQSLNPDEILNAALDKVLEFVHLDVGGIYLFDPERRKLNLVVHRGISKEFAREVESVSVDEKTLEAVIAEGKLRRFVLSVEAVVKDRAELKKILSAVKKEGLSLTSGVPVLLQAREEVLGLMIVASRVPRRFSGAELQLLTSIGQHIAVAIQNARLFEEEKRGITQLALINEVGEKAASILDLDRLMPEVTRSIQERFNYYNVALFLLDEECREVVMQAVAGGFEHIAPGEYRQSLDEGIIGFVVRTGKSWLASDVSQDPYYVKGFLEEVLTQSELCIPVKLGDKVIGALDVQSTHINDFDQSDVAAMEAVADRLAIAIENARLFEEARRRLHELESLVQANAAIISTLELRPQLENILNAAMAVVPAAEKGSILLLDEATGELAIQTLVGYSDPRICSARFPREAGYSAKAVREGCPLLIPDARADPSIRYDGEIEEVRAILSAAVVPLQVKGHIIGIIALDNASRKAAFNEDDLHLLTTFADQAAIVIENARLYEAAQQELAERKRAEEELRESERKLRLIAENATDVIFAYDMDRRLIYVNHAVEELTGYSEDELRERNFINWLHPEDEARMMELWEELFEGKGFSGEEFRIVTKDGQVKWGLSSWGPLYDESGRQIGVQGQERDITKRKRAEEALAQERILLRTVIDNLPDAIYLKDTATRKVLANRADLENIGKPEAEVLGKTDWDVFPAEVASRFYADDQAVLQSGQAVVNREELLVNVSGQGRWLLTSKLPLRDNEGRIIGIVGIGRDITERERAERLLQALNKAALAMERALTPEEIFTTVAEELKKLGFFCVVLLTDASQKKLFPKYFSYETGAIKTAEKLVGLKAENLPIPVETVDVYRTVVWERKTILVENVEEVVRQLLPGPARRFAGQITNLLKVPKSIPAPLIVEDKVIGVLSVESDDLTEEDIPAITAFAHQMAAAWHKATLLQDLERSLAEVERAQEELRHSYAQLRRTFEGTIQVLVSAIEMRDPYTAGHQRRVTQLVCAIAKEMGLPEDRIEGLRMAGLIHDIGKLKVPAEILSKPGPLTELEFGLIKMHPQVGYDVLDGTIEFPWPVAQIVFQHHERMDGSGYPQGLSGEEIILEARILGVADVVEAIASHRPYRSARGIDQALEEISQNRGILYDSEVVDACLKLFTEKGFTFDAAPDHMKPA